MCWHVGKRALHLHYADELRCTLPWPCICALLSNVQPLRHSSNKHALWRTQHMLDKKAPFRAAEET